MRLRLDRSSGDPAATERRPATRWLADGVYWAATASLVFSIVGLVLAVAGWFAPVPLVVLWLPATVALGRWGWPAFRQETAERITGGLLPAVVVVLVIAAAAASAAAYSGEHLLTNRDPGVYLTTGRWLADEGTLLVEGKVGGFAGVDGVTASSLGHYEVRDDGTVDPQFLHMLPTWGAMAHWLGGDPALFRVNVLAVALAIAAFWLFAAMLIRPWYAVLATAALAVSLPTVHFARNLYSEPIALFFAFAGFGFLILAKLARHPGLSLIAGLFAGAAATVRIDGWFVVIGVTAYLMAVWWKAQQNADQDTVSRFAHPALAGVFIAAAVGIYDGLVRARPYLTARSDELLLLFGALFAVIAVGLLAMRRPGVFDRLYAWYGQHRNTLAWVVAITIVGIAAVLFFVRPLVQEGHAVSANPVTEFAQQANGLEVDGTRIYAEWTMHWLSWYLGVLGLGAGVVGLAWAWRRAMLGVQFLWPFLISVSLATAAYVVRPSITPDQLWAMRRFLPLVIPGLVFAAVLAWQWGTDMMTRPPLRWASSAAAVAVLLVLPASFTWPLRTSTSYVGMHAALEEVCDAVPEGAAVMMASRFHSAMYQAPVRSFCGVPVAGLADDVTNPVCVVAAAHASWKAQGVDLIVGYGGGLELTPEFSLEIDYELPELTITRRPEAPTTLGFGISLADADGLDTTGCPA